MIEIKGLLYKEIPETFCFSGSDEEIESHANALWQPVTEYDEPYIYDFDERIYKKRKVYFYINDRPLKNIDIKAQQDIPIPAAFFAMGVYNCLDFFRNKFVEFKTAYLHRCINNRPINIFNPASESDIANLNFSQNELARLRKAINFAKENGKDERYWASIEDKEFLNLISCDSKYDGIALDFNKYGDTSSVEYTENFCLFEKSVSAMSVLDSAKINDISKLPVDPCRLRFDCYETHFQKGFDY